MSITVKPVTPQFVAEIAGIDLAKPLTPADRDAIEDAINRYAIVVFHDQTLSDDRQIAFARRFGPIQASAQRARHHDIKHRLASGEIADISNLDGEGRVLEPDSRGARSAARHHARRGLDARAGGIISRWPVEMTPSRPSCR